jgi:hypothetical protein
MVALSPIQACGHAVWNGSPATCPTSHTPSGQLMS